MTYREAILLGESILQKAKIVDAKNDAWLLLAMACRIDHTYYYVHMDEEMSQEQIREYQACRGGTQGDRAGDESA